jgi:hypothetical protein
MIEDAKRRMQYMVDTLEDKFTDLPDNPNLIFDMYEEHKEGIFLSREKNMRVVDGVLVAKFFPTWRSVSKKQGLPFVMPGDVAGEYKIRIDTSKDSIIAVNDSVYLHENGFIATCRPTGTHIGIATLSGKLYEVEIDSVEFILHRNLNRD